MAKTLYGQTLDSNLHDPYAAFGLTLLFVLVMTTMLFVARTLDRGKALFPFPTELASLRRLSVICICLGISGILLVSARAENPTAAPGGAAAVLGSALREYYFLGLIAEAVYAVNKTGARSVITPRLALFFLIQAIVSTSFNERGPLVTSLIAIGTVYVQSNSSSSCYYRYNCRKFFHFCVYTDYALFEVQKTGLYLTEFAEVAERTIARAAMDPEFFKLISDTQKYSFYHDMDVPYDYYGIRSEVLECLSFVSLVDAVYDGTRTREPLGMEAVGQVLTRIAPGFLDYDKEIANIGPGDWLSWQTGLEEPGKISFSVFGLPMEGLASWGLPGMIAYPFIFMFPVLYICGRLSSLKLSLPLSIFLFVVTQHFFFDTTADYFLGWMTRDLLVLILGLTALTYILRLPAVLPRTRAI